MKTYETAIIRPGSNDSLVDPEREILLRKLQEETRPRMIKKILRELERLGKNRNTSGRYETK